MRGEGTQKVWTEKILNDDNIEKAYKRVFANKGAGGVYGFAIRKLEEFLTLSYLKII